MHRQRFVIAALTLIASSERAPADPRAEAKPHVERATQLHAQGKFAQALDELKTAFSLDPDPELLYAMGQLHVSLGECPQAITYYQRYLAMKPVTANLAIEAIKACETNRVAPTPWYGDHVADALVAGGVAAGFAGIFEYRAAVQSRDRADTATSYQRYVDLVDRADSQRAAAIVLGVAGAALATAGGWHYLRAERRARQTLSVRPSQGGGLVTWTGAFQ